MSNRAATASIAQFGEILHPEEAQEPILAAPVRAALLEWLMEIWAADELKEVGLVPRTKALFHGAPGTGKTTLAHHLAARLGLPMLVVRGDKLVSRWVSAGAENIGRLFDAIKTHESPVFLFIDEFDGLAGKRMGSGKNEVGEQDHNHSVNTLLACMENYEGFMVAATNFGARVDEAIWRRFQIQIELDLPGPFERARIFERYLSPFVLPNEHLDRLADALATATPALLRSFCEHIKRQLVIGPKAGWSMGRDDVIARVVETVRPHPSAPLPRLWSHGAQDASVRALPWPLTCSLDDYPDEKPIAADPSGTVVALRRRGEA